MVALGINRIIKLSVWANTSRHDKECRPVNICTHPGSEGGKSLQIEEPRLVPKRGVRLLIYFIYVQDTTDIGITAGTRQVKSKFKCPLNFIYYINTRIIRSVSVSPAPLSENRGGDSIGKLRGPCISETRGLFKSLYH